MVGERFVDEGAMLRAGFVEGRCHVEVEKEYHTDFRSLLVGLKRIGAQNASRSRPRGLFPRRVMHEMNRLYLDAFRTDEGLSASYGVLYGVAVNKE